MLQSKLLGRTPSRRCLLAFVQIWNVVCPVLAPGTCEENQTVELAKQGIIHCSFPDDFHAVYWYEDLADDIAPVIVFTPKSGSKTGHGFQNKTYDVLKNGNLHISSVTAWHQRRYKVILENIPNNYETFIIAVDVIADPREHFPTIECDDCQQNYYHLVERNKALTCTFTISRPPVHLKWILRSPEEDIVVKEQSTNTAENKDGTFNSSATVHLTRDGDKLIRLLVCRAKWDPGTWITEKQILLDFSNVESFSSLFSSVLYIEVNRRGEVQCARSNQAAKIWKRITSGGEPETIGFSAGNVTKIMTTIPNMKVSVEGSLVFSLPQIYHEGIYLCLYGDGKQNEYKMTSVRVLVPPSPPYIQIIGCEDRVRPCKFKEEDTHQVTCAVYGTYPNVSLKWIAKNPNEISFSLPENNVTKQGKTFNIVVAVNFKVSEDMLCEEDISIECHIDGPLANVIRDEAQVQIIPKFCKPKKVNGSMIFWQIFMIVIVICILVSQIVIFRCICRTQNGGINGCI